MNTSWQKFFEHGKLSDSSATIINVSQSYGLLEFSGEDSASFLQGQLTNDIHLVSEKQSQYSGYCTPKGRLLAIFHIFMRDGRFYLQLPLEILDSVKKRLQMFVLMSKVTITDVSHELVSFAIHQPQRLKGTTIPLPEIPWQSQTADGLTVIKLPYTNTLVGFTTVDKGMALLQQLQVQENAFADVRAWEEIKIRAGLATIFAASSEAFVPQMVNLHLIDAINFKKGCYTGQEVVARMHYLGKLKRLMYLFEFDSTQAPRIGDPLYSPDSSSGQGAGKIVSVAAHGDSYLVLAVVELKLIEADSVFLDAEHQIKGSVIPLPYPMEKS